MKKLILTTALASLMALSASSFAADTTDAATTMKNTSDSVTNAPSEMQGKMGAKMMKHKMAADAARLNLTPDQKTKIDGLMKDSKTKLDTDIRAVLDDKQKVEFDKIQAEHKAAWSKSK